MNIQWGVQNVMGVLFAIIVFLVGIAASSTVATSIQTVLALTDFATDFPLATLVYGFLMVIYVLALMALAGGIAYIAIGGRRAFSR